VLLMMGENIARNM